MRHDTHRQGFALIAVMAALAILLTLVTAFLAGVFNEAESSSKVVAQAATDHRNQGQRDLILQIASQTDKAEDATPFWDAKAEFPRRLDIPAAFKAKGPRKYSSISSGEVWDLQGRININTASPMLVANLLGLSASLKEEVPPDGDTLAVDEGSSFPAEGGTLLVDGEVIRYQRREGNTFTGLERTLLDHTLPEDTLVLDYRCVVLLTRMYDPTGNSPRNTLTPYSDIQQVNLVSEQSRISPFTEAEMDLLLKHCTTDSGIELASRWGKPQRIFTTLDKDVYPAVLRVKSALGLGAGTLVRIRSLENDTMEYALVAKTARQRGRRGDINLQLPSWELFLLAPLRNDFTSMQAVVEPLVRHPININTAEPEVLVAMLRNLRKVPNPPPPGNDRRGGQALSASRFGPKIGLQYARDIANRILQLRGDRGGAEDGSQIVGPFNGWEDLCKRLLTPLGQEASSNESKSLILLVLHNWLTGRTALAEMPTAPISFTSASLVRYRVATMDNKFSLDENARRERQGIASVVPSKSLDFPILTQDTWEECFRLSRGCPGYISYPINVAPLHPRALGDDPADHVTAYLWASLWPGSGFGEPRYPNRELADVGVRQAPAIARPEYGDWATHESFRYSRHPEGRDVTQEGHYEMLNNGPTGPGTGIQRRRGGHDQKQFRFTGDQGMPRRYAIHGWWHPRSLVDQSFFEAAGNLRERNMISLRVEERHFVFEILDEAGLDPDVRATRTQVERTAGQIRIPIAELNLKDDTPVHFNFAADGTRPGQMSMMVDGVPRKGTRFMTWLTREIPVWEQPQGAPAYDPGDKAHYIEIHVEDTEHFPDQGVLRIGREIFEYTSKDKTTFYCKDSDSMGGRKARLRWYELRDELDAVDNTGRINMSESRITRTEQERAPVHPEGAAVELYGYAAPIYRNTLITQGVASLVDKVGAFAVGRGFLKNPDDIVIPVPQGAPLRLGRGLLETNKEDLELANPVPDAEGKGYPPDKAENRIFDAFPESGGFALLVQRGFRVRSAELGVAGEIIVGGVEIISYGSRKGHVLSGIKRGVTLPNINASQGGQNSQIFDGKAHIFVTDWDQNIVSGRGKDATPIRELAGYVLYVVPISLPVRGSLTDPTVLGLTEWAQIYPRDEERKTEWVRYDVITEGQIVRSQPRAFLRVHNQITGQTNRGQIDLSRGGGTVQSPAVNPAYNPPDRTLENIDRIGYVESIEYEHPVIYQARRALQFRGDPTTNTSSHDHAAGTTVTPTHRLELDAGIYGGLSARAGRNDRVAFVGGTQAHGGNRPPVEWQTVNWVWQRHAFDVDPDQNENQNSTPSELLGPTPFQLIGLKAGVSQAYVGAPKRDDFRDTRQVDRVVKFPSGELPAAYVDHAKFGGSTEYQPTQGLVDEAMAVWRQSEPLVLLADMNKEAQQFNVHQHLRVFPWGTITVAQDLTGLTPNYGGLVMIDGEILAYRSHAGGVFQVAENGRGLLGTEPRAHGRGTRVHFLRHLPAAVLAAGLSENSHQLVFNNLGNLPRVGGTLLLGQELLHYTWTVGHEMVEMPIWREPADDEQSERAEKGLFRGRYGTVPQSAAGGEVAIYFPTRYWDRFHERADDPEMSYAQVTLDQHDVFYDKIRWTEENPDQQLLDLRCYVRVDGLAPFDADPEKERMLFLFKEGTVNDKANVLHRQGSVLEARFMTEYRPGAFDPENFLMHAWKLTPTLRDCVIEYEGETHILKERIVQR